MNYWKNLLRVILKRNSLTIFLIFIILCSFSSVHAEQHESRKAVLIIMNFTNIEKLAAMPKLNRLMQNGAVGLMNTRGASKTDSDRAYATLGWGSRADVLTSQSFVQKNSSSFYLKEIDEIKKLNLNNPYNIKVGLLGDFLHSQGLKTSFIGSQIIQGQQIFPGALIAVDGNGIIDSGIIDNQILLYNSETNGYRTDYEALLNVFKMEYSKRQFIVIDTGDTSRYEYYGGIGRMLQPSKEDVLQDIDKFIGQLTEEIDDKNTLLIVLSPHYGSEDARLGRKLCPVVFYGADTKSGLLASDTTRRPGIIGNIDIAPTIISFFGGTSENVTGRIAKTIETGDHLKKISDLFRLTAFNSLNRTIILKTYVAFQIVLLLIILIFILISASAARVLNNDSDKQKERRIRRLLQIMVLFTLICPLTLFIMPLLNINSLPVYALLLVSITAILGLLVYKIVKDQEMSIIIISAITAISILVDLLLNGPLNKTSLLGYDAVIGARYYGLGNEYMGILIAAVLTAVLPLAQKGKLPRGLAVILLIMVLPVIGLTMFGANVGGTIAATVSFGFASFILFNKKITASKVFMLFGAVFLVVSLFALYDILWAPRQSHLARALLDTKSKGIDIIFDIIRRKVEMNLKLLRWTIWSQVLIVSVMVVGILFLKPRGMLNQLFNKYKSFSIVWYSILVASVVGMIVNDSGVVVAATSNIFLAFSLLYFLLGEEHDGIQRIRENRS